MRRSTPKWRRGIVRLFGLLAAILVVVYFAISGYGAYRVTHPVRHPIHTTPEPYGMAYENVSFTSVPDGITLNGWFMDSPGTRTLLVLHGAGSTMDNFINMEVGRVLYQHGFDLLMFDFRAHGNSGGEISSIGDFETRDIAGALAYLKGRGITEVGAIGWSMGAAALINAAPEHPEIKAMVADSSFASLTDIVSLQRGAIGVPALFDPGIELMARLMYGVDLTANQPRQAIARLTDRPVLLVHTSGDPLIPVAQSQELAEADKANSNLQLWIVTGMGHVSAFSMNEQVYMDRVIQFFDANLR